MLFYSAITVNRVIYNCTWYISYEVNETTEYYQTPVRQPIY